MTPRPGGVPRLTIEGLRISADWSIVSNGGLVQVADLALPWGRSSIYGTVDGHLVTAVVLDTASSTGSPDADLVGRRATITRVDGSTSTVLVDGMVADQQTSTVDLRDPETGMIRTVRRYTLSIADTPAVLATLVVRGRGTGTAIYGQGSTFVKNFPPPWGIGGWNQQWPSERIADVQSAAGAWAPPIITPTSTLPAPIRDDIRPGPASPIQAGVPADQLVPLWTLIHRVMAASAGLAWPRVIPGTRIERGIPMPAAHVQLVKASGVLKIATTNIVISSQLLELVDKTARPSLDSRNRIGSVLVAIEGKDMGYQAPLEQNGVEQRAEDMLSRDGSTTVTYPVDQSRGSSTSLQIDAGASGSILRAGTSADDPRAWRVGQADKGWNAGMGLAQDAAMRAAYLNDWLTLPTVRYRPRSGPVADVLLRVYDTPQVYLSGSMWAPMTAAPRVVHIIGGTLTWTATDGWQHDLTLAPTFDLLPRNLTMTELLGPIVSTIGAFAPDVTINDLSAVSERTAT